MKSSPQSQALDEEEQNLTPCVEKSRTPRPHLKKLTQFSVDKITEEEEDISLSKHNSYN